MSLIGISSFSDNTIYKLNLDGLTRIKLADEPTQSALSVGKYLYYISSNRGALYRINTENGEVFDVDKGSVK